MEFEELLGKTRWAILAEASKGDRSASEIAVATGTSLANISQQTKLLEAWGFLKLGKRSGKAGKPRLTYSLKKELAYIALVRRGAAIRRTLPLDRFRSVMLNILLYPKGEEQHCLFRLFWEHEDYFMARQAVAVVESDKKELHLLVLARAEELEALRKEYSKLSLSGTCGEKTGVETSGKSGGEGKGGGGKSVIIWTHSRDELRRGLEKGEPYFLNLFKHLHVLIDPEGTFQELRGEERVRVTR